MDIVNRRTWLGFEDYILQNARAWKDRCSVLTGALLGSPNRIKNSGARSRVRQVQNLSAESPQYRGPERNFVRALSDFDAFSNEEAAIGGLTLSAELKALSDIRV